VLVANLTGDVPKEPLKIVKALKSEVFIEVEVVVMIRTLALVQLLKP
jgi:hypothetical protein